MAQIILSTLVALSILGALGPRLFSGRSFIHWLARAAPLVIALCAFQWVAASTHPAPPGDELYLGAMRFGAVVLNAGIVWLVAVPIVGAACQRSQKIVASMAAALVASLAYGIVFVAGVVVLFLWTLVGCLIWCP